MTQKPINSLKEMTEAETHRDLVDNRAPWVNPGMILLSYKRERMWNLLQNPESHKLEDFRNYDTALCSLEVSEALKLLLILRHIPVIFL